MNTLSLGFLAVYLSGRLFFYDVQIMLGARQVQKTALYLRIGWGLLLILFAPFMSQFGVAFLFYLSLVALDSYAHTGKLRFNRWIYGAQILVLFVELWGLSRFSALRPILPNPFYLLRFCGTSNRFRYLLILDGFLFTQKEATIFIRLVLQRLRAFPKQEPENRKKDQREYELGRIIGLLERTFLYFLIIWNQIGAIAVLVALKSLARYKELENKTFAEYFLIGSLLSILSAAIPAVIVRLWLN